MSGDPVKPGVDVDRRTFVRRLVLNSTLAAGALAAGWGVRKGHLPLDEERKEAAQRNGNREKMPGSAEQTVLAIARSEDPAAGVALALDALGGMDRFVSRGDQVLVKPNVGWDRRPKFAANTNPEVVRAVVQLCLEAGAKKVWVTDSPCNNPARCFDKSGMKKSLEGMEVTLFTPTDRDYVETDLGGEVLRTWPVLKVMLESDKIINVPIAKHHSSAVLSMGMKNWFGILGGGKRRGQLHQEMALAIAELADYVRPHLTVLDAHRILVRNGPQGGTISDTKVVNTVAASQDPVAVDAFGATLFGLEPSAVPYIPLGEQKGLGHSDLEAVEQRVRQD
jgi:uncharacterized protein (DUF362 family)